MDDKLLKFAIGLQLGLFVALVRNSIEYHKIHKRQMKLHENLEKIKIDIDNLEKELGETNEIAETNISEMKDAQTEIDS